MVEGSRSSSQQEQQREPTGEQRAGEPAGGSLSPGGGGSSGQGWSRHPGRGPGQAQTRRAQLAAGERPGRGKGRSCRAALGPEPGLDSSVHRQVPIAVASTQSLTLGPGLQERTGQR